MIRAEPMLAECTDVLPEGPGWPDEPKYDGLLRFPAASMKLLSFETHRRSWFTIDIAPLRLERFDYTSRKEMRRMRRRVRELGFALTPAEFQRWNEYLAR